MGENVQRTGGRPSAYKFDRGGSPTEFGPFSGIIMNNVDPTRQGRVQVYIEQFPGSSKDDPASWRTVSYCSPYAGTTPKSSGSNGAGDYPGNQQSYGMWMNAPDIGVTVMCFFVGGDPNQGYYVGYLPSQGQNRMVPALGAVENNIKQNESQTAYLKGATQLPVTEINNDPRNTGTTESPQFFEQKKPVQSYTAAVMFQQGTAADNTRGPITSSAQRESPSNVFGFSSPGRPIYKGGLSEGDIEQKINDSNTKPQDVDVIGRRGGHSFVMDDGNLTGKDNLVRLKSAKGHQIMMNDTADCIYISHGSGTTWIELGAEGTVDIYSTNSINMRTEGTLNFHADQDINMFAKGKINMKGMGDCTLQSDAQFNVACKGGVTLYSEAKIGFKSNGTLAIVSKGASIDGGPNLSLNAKRIDIQGGSKIPVETPTGLTKYLMPSTSFNSGSGWQTAGGALESIVTRAPTHEPYPYHNKGVSVEVALEQGQPTPPPGAPSMPNNWSITKK